jgi:hypothetical protein
MVVDYKSAGYGLSISVALSLEELIDIIERRESTEIWIEGTLETERIRGTFDLEIDESFFDAYVAIVIYHRFNSWGPAFIIDSMTKKGDIITLNKIIKEPNNSGLAPSCIRAILAVRRDDFENVKEVQRNIVLRLWDSWVTRHCEYCYKWVGENRYQCYALSWANKWAESKSINKENLKEKIQDVEKKNEPIDGYVFGVGIVGFFSWRGNRNKFGKSNLFGK